jgi:hypothetical protein
MNIQLIYDDLYWFNCVYHVMWCRKKKLTRLTTGRKSVEHHFYACVGWFFFLLFIFIWLPPTFLCVFLRHGSLTSSRQRFTPLTHQKKNRKDPSDGLMMSELRPEKNKGASRAGRKKFVTCASEILLCGAELPGHTQTDASFFLPALSLYSSLRNF